MDRGEVLYLWLFAEGLHKKIMTSRILENRKRQKASSIHSSLQSYSSWQIGVKQIYWTKKTEEIFITCNKRMLTDWHLVNLKVFVVHTMNMTDAERETEFYYENMGPKNKKQQNNSFVYTSIQKIWSWHDFFLFIFFKVSYTQRLHLFYQKYSQI